MDNQSRQKLSFAHLRRFEETLKTPLRRGLETGRVELLPWPAPDPESNDPLRRAAGKGRAVYDERGKRLVVPLFDQGSPLGVLAIWQVEPDQLGAASTVMLAALVEAALEMVRLRLLAETDPVTGLATEEVLDGALLDALARLRPARLRSSQAMDGEPERPGVSLVTLRPAGMSGLLDRYGRRFGDQVFWRAARELEKTASEATCLARAGGAFLILVTGGAGPARELAQRLRGLLTGLDISTPDGHPWSGRAHLGAATLDARTWDNPEMAAETAGMLKTRAFRALASAERSSLDEVLFFGEIVEKTGQLRELLPLDRVVVDLGRIHGLREGERFQVIEGRGYDAGSPTKAELVVVTVGESESVAEVTAITDPTRSLRPGDRLRRLGQEAATPGEAGSEQMVAVGDRQIRVVLDEVTQMAGHRSFMALFAALGAAHPSFAAGLVQVEGLEAMRQAQGRVGADALIKALATAAGEVFPPPALLGRFAPDTLSILLPATQAEGCRELCAQLVEKFMASGSRPVRAGVAAHPCPGFTPADVLDNAAKALAHAGFLEPGAVVVFDAVSLNISGDALFAQGRISEALAEFERALLLEPDEPNVLNSLGVCHGHLGQMNQAMAHFERALAAAPQDFMAYYNLGYALMAQGRLAEAKTRLEQGLELNPDHADTLFHLGRLAQGEGKLSLAVDYLSRAAAAEESPRSTQRHLGEALAAAGQPPQAEEAFKRAVKTNPNDAAALCGLAELYLKRGANVEIALSLARRATQVEPASARYLRVKAQALSALERREEAAEVLRQAARQHGQDPFLALQLGAALLELGQADAARDEYVRALSLEPHLDEARTALRKLDQSANAEAGSADDPGEEPEKTEES